MITELIELLIKKIKNEKYDEDSLYIIKRVLPTIIAPLVHLVNLSFTEDKFLTLDG